MSTPTYKNLSSLVEQPNSRAIKYSERLQITYIYKGLYDDCAADALPKGTAGTGSLAGYLVAESSVQPERGLLGTLSIVWESGGAGALTPLPQDEVAVTASNQAPLIERHWMFRPLDGTKIGNEYVMDIAYDAAHAATAGERQTHRAKLTGNALALKLVDKIRAGNQSFYLATLRYSWATHSYSVPSSTRGGYIETPGGPLASYFSGSYRWLREADDLAENSGIWRHTRSWLGSNANYWDLKFTPHD